MWESGNQEISNNEIFFEEKRENIKYKNRNRVYTIHGGDYKRKSNPNPHTNLVLMPVLGQVMLNSLRSRSSN